MNALTANRSSIVTQNKKERISFASTLGTAGPLGHVGHVAEQLLGQDDVLFHGEHGVHEHGDDVFDGDDEVSLESLVIESDDEDDLNPPSSTEVNGNKGGCDDRCENDAMVKTGSVSQDIQDDIDASIVEERVPQANSHENNEQKTRVALEFFRKFLSDQERTKNDGQLLNPITELQTRYSAYQYKQDKQAKQKGLKDWYQDNSWGKGNDLWWSCKMTVPNDIMVGMMGCKVGEGRDESVGNEVGTMERETDSIAQFISGTPSIAPFESSSGDFPLNQIEKQNLAQAFEGRDLLLELCGEYKFSSPNNSNGKRDEGIVLFKKKTVARKSAALNLLLAMDLGSCDDNGSYAISASNAVTNSPKLKQPLGSMERQNGMEKEPSIEPNGAATEKNLEKLKDKMYPSWVEKIYNLGIGGNVSDARFVLQSINIYGTDKCEGGSFLSADNPCLMQCKISILDKSCDNESQNTIDVASGFHRNVEATIYDAVAVLESRLKSKRLTSTQDLCTMLSDKEYILKMTPTSIHFKDSLPRWSTAKIDSEFYLYELEFHLQKSSNSDGNPISLSHAFGLEPCVATRIGVLLGSELFDGNDVDEDAIISNFSMPRFEGIDSVTVKMCNGTRVTLSEMTSQIHCTSPRKKFDHGEDPITLLQCFNILLFGSYKTYGMAPFETSWRQILCQMDSSDESTGNNRTYLFLPLLPKDNNDLSGPASLKINWRVVWDNVHHNPLRVLNRFDIDVCLPYTPLRWVLLSLFLVMLAACTPTIAVCFESTFDNTSIEFDGHHTCPRTRCFSSFESFMTFDTDSNNVEAKVFIVSFVASFIVAAVEALVKPSMLTKDFLKNYFLIQPIGFKNKVFDSENQSSPSVTSFSRVLSSDIAAKAPDELKQKYYQQKKVELKDETFARYFGRILELPLRYPRHPLIATSLVQKHTDHDFTLERGQKKSKLSPIPKSIKELMSKEPKLVPELAYALPMPRDILYICQHASKFMSRLEHACLLHIVSSRLSVLKRQYCQSVCTENDDTYRSLQDNVCPLRQATFLRWNVGNTRDHERLEALGDSLLLFLIVVNTFAKIPSNEETFILDKFDEVIHAEGKNKTLLNRAVAIGLHRLIQKEAFAVSTWKSRYQKDLPSFLSCESTYKMNLPNKTISNLFESVLGAIYLKDPSGGMSVGFLNEVGFCCSELEGKTWFDVKGTCLMVPFSFGNNGTDWSHELDEMLNMLKAKQSIFSRLETNSKKLCQILLDRSNRGDLINKLESHSNSSLLVHCALFDDSLEQCTPETEGLDPLAVLRDKIFHIGNAGLQLKVVEYLYRIHPTATSGDIHFMKTISLAHDALSYILIKNKFHECLFDEHAESLIQFQLHMKKSDVLGSNEWNKRGGWILPGGGLKEFQSRMKSISGEHCTLNYEPRYVGLAAGRLWGHHDKLPGDVTDELSFSFKCIVGAIALSLGLDDAWCLFRPFFLELMVLSADELRNHYKGISSLTSKYEKGNR